MMTTRDLLAHAESLPVEDRAALIDCLLKTLNAPQDQIDRKWIEVAQKRLEELRSGKVEPIPGDKVLQRVKERFDR